MNFNSFIFITVICKYCIISFLGLNYLFCEKLNMLNFNLFMIQELLHHTSTLFRWIASKCSCHSRIVWVAFEPLHLSKDKATHEFGNLFHYKHFLSTFVFIKWIKMAGLFQCLKQRKTTKTLVWPLHLCVFPACLRFLFSLDGVMKCRRFMYLSYTPCSQCV